MRVAIAQMDIVLGDIEKNLNTGLSLIKEAKNLNCDLVLLPEVWPTGFLFKELKNLSKYTDDVLKEIKNISNGISICGTYVVNNEEDNKRVFNKFFSIRDGEITFEYSKVMLFGVTGEDEYFSRGNMNQNNVFELNNVKIGVSICYELRFPEFFRKSGFKGALIHLLPALWPIIRLEHWNNLSQARAIENQYYFLSSNGIGTSGKMKLAGNSKIYSPWGEILQDAESSIGLKYVDIDFKEIEKARTNIPSLRESMEFLDNCSNFYPKA